MSLDLNLLPLARSAGQDYPELLCLHVCQPPRRPARGREADRLILYLAMTGNAPLPPGKQDQALADLARVYYATPGSVTAALRRVAEELNASLLERNLRLAGSSRQAWGVLAQVALRENQMYLAHSGPVHTFWIAADQASEFYDPDQADQGLGQAKVPPIQFFQAALQPGDVLALAAQPAPDWTLAAWGGALGGLHGQGPESLRRKLVSPALLDLNAVLIQTRPGKGQINVLRPPQSAPARPLAAPGVAPARPASPPPAAAPLLGLPNAAAEVEAARLQSEEPPFEPPPAPSEAPEPELLPAAAVPPAEAPPAAPPSRRPLPLLKAAAVTGAALGAGMRAAGRSLATLLARLLPGEPFEALPSSMMAFVALALPVVLALTGSLAYLRLGRDVQNETLLAQAQQMAARGLQQQNVAARRADLDTALALLKKYRGDSPAIQNLRGQVQTGLDELDLIRRVGYQPAIIRGLPPAVRVTRLAVVDEVLYLLDGASGNVLRASQTSSGYQLDEAFQCGPLPGNNPPVGPLVSIAAWPPGYKPAASLVGVDAGGAVIYCQPDQPPRAERLKPPAADAWGKINAFALDLGDAYVLDQPSKGVWIYWRSNFEKDPNLFFNEDIPLLEDVVDLTVNRDDLYLLHLDGSLTLCNYSSYPGVPTRCATPRYLDFRPGRENMPLIPPAPFTQLQNTQPPDPSLFLLESSTRAVYHFSLRNLAFQGQYVPAGSLVSGPATAFAVDNIHHYIYLAVGNQVYYAVLP